MNPPPHRLPTPDYSTRGINAERLEAVRRHAGQSVLDVGCGSGAYVLHLAPELKIRGTDYQTFETWAQSPDLFSVSDAHRLDAADASIDTILSFETLEHLPHPKEALQEYFRVCRKNLILTVPNCITTAGMKKSGVIFNHWIDRSHLQFWQMDSLCSLLNEVGFSIRERRYINHVNLGHLAMESLGITGMVGRVGATLFGRMQGKSHPLTCLVVAEKPTDR